VSDDRLQGKVKEGISVFDLIMPWKSDVVQSIVTDDLQSQ